MKYICYVKLHVPVDPQGPAGEHYNSSNCDESEDVWRCCLLALLDWSPAVHPVSGETVVCGASFATPVQTAVHTYMQIPFSPAISVAALWLLGF